MRSTAYVFVDNFHSHVYMFLFTGGEAVLPTCRPDSISGRKSVFEMDFTVVVQADTKLQLCWSSTAGQTKFTAVFYIGGSTYAVINSSPWYVEKFLIDNKPMTEAKLRAHQVCATSYMGCKNTTRTYMKAIMHSLLQQ